MNLIKCAIPALITSALAVSAYAQDDVAKEPKLWKGEIEASYINLSGNTEETTSSGSFEAIRKREAWRYVAHVDGLSSSKDDERTAEKYYMFQRLEYNFTDKNYVFGRISYDNDHFSGFDYQATVTTGLGRNLLKDDTMDWDIEAGIGYRVGEVDEDSTAEDEKEAILRLSSLYKWKISDTADFTQLVSTEAGDDNTISKSETSLKVKVVGQLSLKLSYKIKYTEQAPDDNDHADTETIVGVTYDF